MLLTRFAADAAARSIATLHDYCSDVEAEQRTTRERLLASAAQLLVASRGDEVTTRAICESAGVGAPTLYHHFGSKQGLLDAVVSHAFDSYLARKRSHESSGDAESDIRDGWDDHVEFGRENPVFYALMYGQVRPGWQPPAAREAAAMLTGLFTRLAAEGRLATTPAQASTQLLAANTGFTLALITAPAGEQWDPGASTRLRDAVLGSLVRGEHAGATAGHTRDVAGGARDLRSALASADPPLDGREIALLDWWLQRLAAGGA